MIANRVNNIKPSFTLEMATKAAEMRSEGIDVINFSVGEPDFNTPKHICDAAKNAIDSGYTKYTAGPGMIEARQAICKKLERDKLFAGAEFQIVTTAIQYCQDSVPKEVKKKVEKILKENK